ncbi:hypothetical protein AKJ37_00540 [candidate division MSBL1 archaeon SCGC-AAA259I09]|uniref:Uncharacterized protein n=1 Tax=candidate division MSBL1 archaeon SCGC-AAA259I09 TaxID=1698267 RepID=A0A133UW14_9EURY|nr:hypothetical protein AKJ37_00540 [candidate division MSBL1 archaeon SCGC-AAA259I09]
MWGGVLRDLLRRDVPGEEGCEKGDEGGKQEEKGKGEKKLPYPEGFCAAFSYVPSHGFYASSVIRDFDFNFLLAKALMAPTEGADWRVMDGHPSYEDFDHWYCLLHRFRNWAKGDEILNLLEDDLPHLVPDYLAEKYAEFRDGKLEELREKRPELFDDEGEFKGSLTTNAMEGGNWRLKYELRTAYSVQESISGRMNLMALKESLHTFKSGEPNRSWAHEHSEFQLEDVMSIELEKTSHVATLNRRGKKMTDEVTEPTKNTTGWTSPVEA